MRRIIPVTPRIAGDLYRKIGAVVDRGLKKHGPHAYVALHIETIGPLYEVRIGEADPDERTVTKFNTIVVKTKNDLLLETQDALERVAAKTSGRFARLVRVDVTFFRGYTSDPKVKMFARRVA